jgi:hypothetical protein
MAGVTKLLERLTRVTQHGPDRWRAVCPAHVSRHQSQSLVVRELSDGTSLICCHAGCGAAEIIEAVGLEMRDLFPASHCAPADSRRPQRPNHYHAAGEALMTVYREAFVVVLVAEDMATGKVPSEADIERCALAASRIRQAYEGVS